MDETVALRSEGGGPTALEEGMARWRPPFKAKGPAACDACRFDQHLRRATFAFEEAQERGDTEALKRIPALVAAMYAQLRADMLQLWGEPSSTREMLIAGGCTDASVHRTLDALQCQVQQFLSTCGVGEEGC